ncbi:AGE family epimerase/isomerase [Marinobacter sp. JSM 1782161]|uniref:AGE family epimerase/isomerase n=1 Tax=Marinobacter sp. JSM 1782161 TaxID=2685906 RepID=UPI0014041FEA|nr:AGE family epimerase/isomerase [Marinobacter sp. JSM 1782161]
MPPTPDFRSADFLIDHIRDTLAFYEDRCLDPDGGFFQYFRDDGQVYNRHHRHLVSSTRFVFNYAMAGHFFNNPAYLERARHGLAYLEQAHWDPVNQGYAWTLDHQRPEDSTRHCYGMAFVLLAYATAYACGIEDARAGIDKAYDLMENRFWLPDDGLYADEASADWSTLSPYRGQNANMHTCEAMLAAYEATGEARFLDRAHTLARNICQRQAAQGDGLIWEHYDAQWRIDWDYNRDDPRHLFRPWGFQPGHQTEWSKLLLILHRHRPEAWMVERARELFDRALAVSWDEAHGGIVYGFAPDGSVCDGDKYFWVQAETFAAAALLAEATGDDAYWAWYERIWAYAWAHFIDHEYGAWYRILTRDNRAYSDEKSPAGKTDYHTMGACYEVIRTLRGAQRP